MVIGLIFWVKCSVERNRVDYIVRKALFRRAMDESSLILNSTSKAVHPLARSRRGRVFPRDESHWQIPTQSPPPG